MKPIVLLCLILSACAATPPSAPPVRDTSRPPASSSAPVSVSKPVAAKPAKPVVIKPSASSPSAAANEVVLYALGLLNVRYQFGGNNPESGLDCSGMTSYIFDQAIGMKLPHNAAAQAKLGRVVERDAVLPGDLVFFNTSGRAFSHVGLYIGNGKFIHAPSTNGQIKVTELENVYFAPRWNGARRIFE